MNSVAISGRMTADPELKQAKKNDSETISYVRYSVAVQAGKDAADFINCVAYGKCAEFVHKYFRKGSRVEVMGELRQNRWKDKDGNNRSELVVKADRVFFGETKAEADARAAESAPAERAEASYYTPPAGGVMPSLDVPQFEEYEGDDGLPF